MKLKHLAITLLLMVLTGCGGSGGSGLNGSIKVNASVAGGSTVLTASATYSNPNTTNLVGVQVTFTILVNGVQVFTETDGTNSSGVATCTPLNLPANAQTVTVLASSDNLRDNTTISSIPSLVVSAPADVVLPNTTAAVGSPVTFQLSALPFVTITDAFGAVLSGHTITITTTVDSPTDSFAPVNPTPQTDSNGKVSMVGNGIMIVPNGTRVMTITFQVKDETTGLTGTGVTHVSLTKI